MKCRALLLTFFCFCVFNQPIYADPGESCKILHSNVFGEVFAGDSPFRIGTIDCHDKGTIHVNVFGDVFCGNSPFSAGRTASPPFQAGSLCQDFTGDIYVKGAPFTVDTGSVIKFEK